MTRDHIHEHLTALVTFSAPWRISYEVAWPDHVAAGTACISV
jgi:hypothetical protein